MKRQVHSLWKMTRRTMLACLVLLGMLQPAMAQTALSYGDVAICGWNNNLVSSNRQIQVVLLKACAANTVFKISAMGFNNSGTANSSGNGRATAGISKWTNTTASTLPAGTVITISNNGTTISSDVGTMSNIPSSCGCGANGSPVVQSTSGGRFFIYYGGTSDGTGSGQDLSATSTSATFMGTPIQLFGFQGTQSGYTAFLTSGTTGNFQTYVASDLASYNVFHSGNAIGGYFTPSRTAGYTAASLRTALLTTSNWTTVSGTGTVSIPSGNFTMGTTPSFTGSTTLSACSAGTSVSINSNLAITDAAAAGSLTETWSILASPAHGTLGGFSATAASTGGAVTPSGLTYTPTSGYTGSDAFSVIASNGTASDTQVVNVTVSLSPNPGTVTTSQDSFCATAANVFVARGGALGGVWTSANTSIATVALTADTSTTVTGIYSGSTMPLGGNTTITYTISTVSCGTTSSTKNVYIRPFSDTGSSITPASGTVLCTGSTLTATSNSVTYGLPRYLNTTYGRTWTSSNTSIASITATAGVITGVSAGTAFITYTTAPNGCGSFRARKSITVTASATGGTISGTTTMCVGASNTLASSGTTGGVWSSSNTSIATVVPSTGVVTGVGVGTADITYTATNSCGSAFSRATVTINGAPSAGTVTGTSPLCVGSSATYTASGAAGGGTWSSDATGTATVSTGGVVTGVAAGSANITYSVSNACGTNSSSQSVTVNTAASAGTISGASSVCQGATTTLTTSGSGGTWSSSATGTASVNPTTGVVTGVAAGSATITYTVSGACGAGSTTSAITVNPLPNAGSISGASTVCTGASTTLTSSGTGGGSWSSSATGTATVSASGVVTGVAAGGATITYSVTNGCGTNAATQAMTVNTTPVAGTISGASSVCVAASTTLTASGSGGTWSSAATGTATVSTGGVVTGVASGSTTISYTVTTACGTDVATQSMTVNPLPNAGTITGSSSVCVGATTTLAGAGGGTWSTADASVASVSAGTVWGVSAGSTTISYSVTNSCGTASATKAMTVNPLPNAGAISGSSSVCEGAGTTLSTSGSGGSWSSAATGTATVSTGGVVIGVAAGSTTISYTASNSCGTDVATQAMTVNPLPNAGSTSGATTVCVSATTTLTAGATGGTWSSSNTARATVSTTGDVTGTGAGSVTISYSVTNSCGTDVATYAMTVNALPNAGAISGASSVCQGSATLLSTSGSGGSWSSSATGIASVSTLGLVSGVAAGSATISYTASNSCGTDIATQSMTVNPLPDAGTLSGASSVCVSATTTLTSSGATGGTWSSSNTARATVDASGVVTGSGAGAVTISYSVTNSCGTDVAIQSVTVNGLPNAGTISGASSVCEGAATTLTTSGTGGSWSSSATGTATISAGGSVHGVAAGSATISYTVTNGCGTDIATQSMTVNPLPNAGTASGASTVCVGATETITSSGSTGGTWSSSNAGRATVSASGDVTGVATGSVTISYSVTNSCGTDVATHAMTVNDVPTVAAISGASTVCQHATITLTDATSGGTWTSVTPSVATVSTTGVVTGLIVTGTTIRYAVSNACGTTTVFKIITVNPLPDPGTISGAGSVCESATTTLTSSGAFGGTWSSSSASNATVATSGDVTGVSAGSATISYSVTNSCGTLSATTAMTVNPLPNAGSLTGTTTVCETSTTTFSASGTAGGTWSTSASTIASVNTSGVVRGMAAGTAEITYSVSNSCGTDNATRGVTVNPLPAAPAAITGVTTIPFATLSTTLSSATGGGTWSSSNTSIMTVNGTGVVTAVNAGTATITYTVSNSCGSAFVTQSVTCTSTNHAPRFVNTGASLSANLCANFTSYPLNAQLIVSDLDAGQTITISLVSGPAHGTAAVSYTTTSTGGGITPVGLSYTPATSYVGSDSITVRVSDGFTSATATVRLNIVAAPAAPVITGATTVCRGGTITLTGTPSGGFFGSMDGNTTTGSTTGIVTGVGGGLSTVYYNGPYSSAGCRTQTRVAINVLDVPVGATVTGSGSTCPGSSTTLSASIAGGTWSSNNTGIATVTGGGSVVGVTSGAVSIRYTVNNGCFSTTTNKPFTVIGVTSLSPIDGTPNVCRGATVLQSCTPTGGTWSSTNTTIAVISSTGLVSGLVAGTDTIVYTYTNPCGLSSSVSKSIVVLPYPNVGTISGPATLVRGTTANYVSSGTATTGVWTSSTPSIATLTYRFGVNATLRGVAVGPDTIRYTATNACGVSSTSYVVSVTSPKNNNGAGTIEDGAVSVSLYPNPTTGLVAVELKGATGNTGVIVTDLTGKVVMAQMSDTPVLNLDLSKLAGGTYLIKLTNDGNTYTEKVVIE